MWWLPVTGKDEEQGAMRITDRVTDPLLNFNGKAFCQLIGRSTELGGTTHHSFIHVVIPKGQSFSAHYHKLAEETYYILRGTAIMNVDEQRLSLTIGQAILLMPREVHDITCGGDEELEFVAVSAPPFDPDDVYLV